MSTDVDRHSRGWAAAVGPERFLVPARAAGVTEETVDGGALVFDRKNDKTLMLNETALATWRACDGKRTLAGITDHMVHNYAVPESVAADHVEQLVALFASAGLLEAEPDAS